MSSQLAGKRALVTGSTSGIGLAVARALATQGVAVMLNGLGEPEQTEATRRALADHSGVPVAFHGADLRKPDEVESLVRAAEADLLRGLQSPRAGRSVGARRHVDAEAKATAAHRLDNAL